MKRLLLLIGLVPVLASCGPKRLEPDAAIVCDLCEDWNLPLQPFRIYGNTWYVGVDGLSSILVETDAGLVLIDAGLPQTAAIIDSNVRGLGFDPLDISTILVSHAHYDHAGGIAALRRLTGATVYSSVAGAGVLSSGLIGEDDPQFLYGAANTSFPAVKNVVPIADGEVVLVGSLGFTAVYTPGHSPGGMSWSWESCALANCYDIVYADSLTAVSAEGYRFSDGPAVQQLMDSAASISTLDCDILLSPHPFFFGLHDKLEKRDAGNPFVNNVACAIYAENALQWLQQRLHSEGA